MTDTITLTLPTRSLDYIAQVLAQRPWAEVDVILRDIQAQVQQQNAQQPVAGANGAASGVGITQ